MEESQTYQSNQIQELTMDTLKMWVLQTRIKLASNQCYSLNAREQLSERSELAIDFEKLLDLIQPLYNKLQMSSNVEKYYANFRVNIVDKAE